MGFYDTIFSLNIHAKDGQFWNLLFNSKNKEMLLDMIQYNVMIWYICQLQLGWHPVAVAQYTFTHKQYIE
jgi:hypothetical protein